MDIEEFRKNGHDFVDWMANYLENIESLPVKPDINPGDIYKQLPDEAPINGEPITDIFNDFKDIILPGMTHWQSPSFHAYFPRE